MTPYPHIDSVFKRDTKGKFLIGEYSQEEFKYLENNPWIWTEKIDGTNIRIMWDGKFTTFGGKTDNAQLPSKLVEWLQNKFQFADPNQYQMRNTFGEEGNVCLYGEGYGAGIQKGGGLYSAEQKFILFDVKIGHWWLKRDAIEDIATKLGLDVVPYIMMETLATMVNLVAKVAEENRNLPSALEGATAQTEGFVGQPAVSLFSRKGERIITKIKVKDFK